MFFFLYVTEVPSFLRTILPFIGRLNGDSTMGVAKIGGLIGTSGTSVSDQQSQSPHGIVPTTRSTFISSQVYFEMAQASSEGEEECPPPICEYKLTKQVSN